MLKYKIPQIVTLTPDCYVDPRKIIFLFARPALKRKNADYLFDNQRFCREPLARLELATYALRMRCSTN